MVKRSLMLNFVHIVRTLFFGLSDIASLYMMWFVVRWLCLETDFEFISATLGFLIGITLLVLTSLVRAIRFKYFGLMLSRMIVMFTFVGFGNNFYQSIVGVNTDSNSLINMLIYLVVINVIILIVIKILDYIIQRIVHYIFENNKTDFVLDKKTIVYDNEGNVYSEVCVYSLKSMNIYNIEMLDTD